MSTIFRRACARAPWRVCTIPPHGPWPEPRCPPSRWRLCLADELFGFRFDHEIRFVDGVSSKKDADAPACGSEPFQNKRIVLQNRSKSPLRVRIELHRLSKALLEASEKHLWDVKLIFNRRPEVALGLIRRARVVVRPERGEPLAHVGFIGRGLFLVT